MLRNDSVLTYEERLQALKLQPLGKRRLRNDLVLTHEILYNHIDLEATQLFKFSRRPGLRVLHQTGRTRRWRNSFACWVVNNWNRLPLSVASVTKLRKFKITIRLICLLINVFLYSIFAPIWSFWALCPLPISKYIQTKTWWISELNVRQCFIPFCLQPTWIGLRRQRGG